MLFGSLSNFLSGAPVSLARNSAAAESGGAPSFLPARAFSLAREARRQFRSK
ncbi:MAG: hypothetical protein US71_C0014G0020 [Parcubacteria group bacterium GW2011_GWD2_38_12]|nr:MAG: hypothetical protein US71_C0014G0020 [Parcubacteria group bacterium GW2011_GWD2_38_12]